jgi:hypothetical protein
VNVDLAGPIVAIEALLLLSLAASTEQEIGHVSSLSLRVGSEVQGLLLFLAADENQIPASEPHL